MRLGRLVTAETRLEVAQAQLAAAQAEAQELAGALAVAEEAAAGSEEGMARVVALEAELTAAREEASVRAEQLQRAVLHSASLAEQLERLEVGVEGGDGYGGRHTAADADASFVAPAPPSARADAAAMLVQELLLQMAPPTCGWMDVCACACACACRCQCGFVCSTLGWVVGSWACK